MNQSSLKSEKEFFNQENKGLGQEMVVSEMPPPSHKGTRGIKSSLSEVSGKGYKIVHRQNYHHPGKLSPANKEEVGIQSLRLEKSVSQALPDEAISISYEEAEKYPPPPFQRS